MSDICPSCRAPLGEDSQFCNGKRHCAACSAMYFAVNSIEFFRTAEEKYQEEKKNIDRLRSGGNYFS